MGEILEIVKKACYAKQELFCLDTNIKNEVLLKIAEAIESNKDKIFQANKKDLEDAAKMVEAGSLTKSNYQRLKLDENKMRDMIQGVYDVIKLEDPANKVIFERELDLNLVLKKVSCPIGLIGVIFEARPDVILQIASLAIKSGNAVILKGGSEASSTNKAIFEIIKNEIIKAENFPDDAISLVFSHQDIDEILKLDEYIDLIIPRGSNKLVKYIQENTKIPVLGHASGICHIFLDEFADFDMAKKIVLDSKTQYPSACNSVETLLLHKDFKFGKEIKEFLTQNGVKIVENPERFDFEYSDKILALKTVNSLDCAIEHINKYGSGHTDCIITNNKENAEKFMKMVDSAGVFVNASTRFSDGFRYGFGAEVGISTNKTLQRGPVGLDGLCVYKYKLFGSGQIVDDYVKGLKHFTHKNLS